MMTPMVVYSKVINMLKLMDNFLEKAVIKVIGVGGGGGNAIEHMVHSNIDGIEFIYANTDAQALQNATARSLVQLGASITKGLGAGTNPEIGRKSALEDKDRIYDVLEGSDMIFITAGMGGGTGTGAAPVVAEMAKELGILTVAIVTTPFPFEGRKRIQIADIGTKNLGLLVDSLITIPNVKLLSILGKGITLLDAFKTANNVLLGVVQGIADLITRPGLINVDFTDVRTVISKIGIAMMGSGSARGGNRARAAAETAVSGPLLKNINLDGARGVLINITAGMDMSISEFEEVGDEVKIFTTDDATVIVGTVIDPYIFDELKVTVVATGLGTLHNHEIIKKTENIKQHQIAKSNHINCFYQEKPEQSVIVCHQNKFDNFEITSIFKQSMNYLDIPSFLRRQAN